MPPPGTRNVFLSFDPLWATFPFGGQCEEEEASPRHQTPWTPAGMELIYLISNIQYSVQCLRISPLGLYVNISISIKNNMMGVLLNGETQRGHWISPLPCINKKKAQDEMYCQLTFHWKSIIGCLKLPQSSQTNTGSLKARSTQLKIPGIEMFGKRSYLGLSQVVDRSVFCSVPTPYLMF